MLAQAGQAAGPRVGLAPAGQCFGTNGGGNAGPSAPCSSANFGASFSGSVSGHLTGPSGPVTHPSGPVGPGPINYGPCCSAPAINPVVGASGPHDSAGCPPAQPPQKPAPAQALSSGLANAVSQSGLWLTTALGLTMEQVGSLQQEVHQLKDMVGSYQRKVMQLQDQIDVQQALIASQLRG